VDLGGVDNEAGKTPNAESTIFAAILPTGNGIDDSFAAAVAHNAAKATSAAVSAATTPSVSIAGLSYHLA
jgi:hypothetical protein